MCVCRGSGPPGPRRQTAVFPVELGSESLGHWPRTRNTLMRLRRKRASDPLSPSGTTQHLWDHNVGLDWVKFWLLGTSLRADSALGRDLLS